MRGPVQSRRNLLTGAAGIAAAGAFPALAARALETGSSAQPFCLLQELSLAGEWAFCLDSDGRGAAQHWHQSEWPDRSSTRVVVPHTWQVMRGAEEYRGLAWYRRRFAAPQEWESSAIRLEFEAVFHSATVWVNGELAGRHLR
ncbi:MAG: sugar-binding domain-containing protein, partial [Steroidobacteraceae bacterium]